MEIIYDDICGPGECEKLSDLFPTATWLPWRSPDPSSSGWAIVVLAQRGWRFTSPLSYFARLSLICLHNGYILAHNWLEGGPVAGSTLFSTFVIGSFVSSQARWPFQAWFVTVLERQCWGWHVFYALVIMGQETPAYRRRLCRRHVIYCNVYIWVGDVTLAHQSNEEDLKSLE